MDMKRTMILLMLLFATLTGGFCVDSLGQEATETDSTLQSSLSIGSKVTAYYFYTTQRCPTCLKIESLSEEAIRSGFAGELETGRLEWKPLNTDEPENEHFVEDYELYTKSLIIVEQVDGKQTRWKNCPKIWELVHRDKKFLSYVQDEVRDYLQSE